MGIFGDAFIYLLAAVALVPVANWLGLGSVLGYLIAGILIGPIFGIIGSEVTDVQHFAEFGVVMMLFLVGLELQPKVLWRMRNQLMGLGFVQILASLALIAAAAIFAFGLPWQSGVVIGATLALSSTAIVLQTLQEKGWQKSVGGQSSFSVLLAQDIAVIPMLALLPLLAIAGHGADSHDDGHHGEEGANFLAGLPDWAHALVVLAVIAGIILVGRYLVQPIFRFIAQARLREIFTAAALLLVIGVALLMNSLGLSPALGTFLAGVVLSGSEYRHELESDIAPFKGLLLGLFFISVGAGINLELLVSYGVVIPALAIGLMALKFAVTYTLAKMFKLTAGDFWLFALGLIQAGEFAFVLFSYAQSVGAVTSDVTHLLTLVVAVSMLLTPVVFIFYERVIMPKLGEKEDRKEDEIDDTGIVVVAGMGRFGQIITRLLVTNGYSAVVLDQDPVAIENLTRVGFKTYYGDASRPDLLHVAGIEEAKIFVAALDNRETQTEMVHHVAHHHPHVRILARAHDRHHVYELENAGAHVVERETFESSLMLGGSVLEELGVHPFKAERLKRLFRVHDKDSLVQLRERWESGGMDRSYLDAMRAHSDTLYDLMKSDRAERHDRGERGWTPPPKGDAKL